eukprot:1194780-Rhodomonas_salina.5
MPDRQRLPGVPAVRMEREAAGERGRGGAEPHAERSLLVRTVAHRRHPLRHPQQVRPPPPFPPPQPCRSSPTLSCQALSGSGAANSAVVRYSMGRGGGIRGGELGSGGAARGRSG